MLKRGAILVMFCLLVHMGYAQADTIAEPDRLAEDFVEVYLVVAEPTSTAYSTLGHACLRLQCDTYGLDYIFTYESEDATKKILSFLSGNLKMGLFNFEPEEYIDCYRDEHRGVLQYKLNLPAEAKTRLWELLDHEVMKGPYLVYDYLERGCAHTALQFIKKSLGENRIKYAQWPEKYNMTRREIVSSNLVNYPWIDCLFALVVGNDADREVRKEDKVVIPTDLVEVFKTAEINGTKIITDEPIVLVEHGVSSPTNKWFNPMLVACICLLISVITLWLPNKLSKAVDIVFLTMITIIGSLIFYVMFIGHLPHTFWNWLFIPFNPFIALFWCWKRFWSIPYLIILLIWTLVMLTYTHKLVNNSFLVLSLCEIIILLKSVDLRLILTKK